MIFSFFHMASLHMSETVIKDEITESIGYEQPENDCTVDMAESYDGVKHFCCSTIKAEEGLQGILLPEPPSHIAVNATLQAPACSPCWNISMCLGPGQNEEVSLPMSRLPHDYLMVKKLLHLTVPKKHLFSRWSKQTTESILMFLESFVAFAQGTRLSYSADKSLALRGPRILKCEECFLEFSGLYDRYLKLFMHYKAAHRLKCNMLIGRKWIKQKTSLEIMVRSWKLDLRYELRNFLGPSVQLCGS